MERLSSIIGLINKKISDFYREILKFVIFWKLLLDHSVTPLSTERYSIIA